MSDALTREVIPYSRFLVFQDRRRRVAAAVVERECPTTIDVSVVSEPAAAEQPGAERKPTLKAEAGSSERDTRVRQWEPFGP